MLMVINIASQGKKQPKRALHLPSRITYLIIILTLPEVIQVQENQQFHFQNSEFTFEGAIW